VKLTGVDGANDGKSDSDDGFSERSVVGAGLRGVPPVDGRACETSWSIVPRREMSSRRPVVARVGMRATGGWGCGFNLQGQTGRTVSIN
jgi:hypothetical protein